MILTLIITAAIVTLVGIAVLKGKCDEILTGFHSEEKRQKYDMKKLRTLFACFIFAVAASLFLLLLKDNMAIFILLSVVVLFHSCPQVGKNKGQSGIRQIRILWRAV